jgi:hypothetical protein
VFFRRDYGDGVPLLLGRDDKIKFFRIIFSVSKKDGINLRAIMTFYPKATTTFSFLFVPRKLKAAAAAAKSHLLEQIRVLSS